MRKSLAAAMFAVTCIATGCMSYRATIVVGATDDSSKAVALSEVDRSKVRMALSRVVQEHGLVVSPEFEGVARESRDNPGIEEEVTALFVTRALAAHNITVVSAVNKKTGQYSVAVHQYGSPWPTNEARAVEAAVLNVLQQELGSHRVQISRRKGRPSLSP